MRLLAVEDDQMIGQSLQKALKADGYGSAMKSVRRHLLLHLMIALLVGSIVISIVSYLSARDEINELFDEHLRQIALVLEQQKSALVTSKVSTPDKSHLKGEEEFLIQIWSEEMKLLYSTHPSIHFPSPVKRGFHTRDFEEADWRSYTTKPNGVILQVSQPLTARDEMILEIALKMLMPVLLQFPIMGLLIWLAVGRSLGSLSVISASLRKRSELSLQPLSLDHIPEEINPLVKTLNDLLNRLDASMTLQRQFTADAAHELRTPLTAVQLQLQLLARANNAKEREEALETLNKGVQRSIRLVEQLLAFARIEAENNRQSFEATNISGLCREMLKAFSARASQKSIDLGMTQDEPILLHANPDGIRTVISNLLENALRYTPEGGRVDLSVYQEQDSAVIEVADNGAGIPTYEHGRIFDRFYRIAGTKEQGTGLGLAIVKSILEKHDATIRVGSGIGGKGASFKVYFPLNPA